MNTQMNYASLAGAYKGAMQGLVYALVQTNIVDTNKYDELKAFIAKEIERIDSTYGKASTGGEKVSTR